eukprot:SAG31_NODE_9270_length_1306_cov_1.342999_1_plen_401_part_01
MVRQRQFRHAVAIKQRPDYHPSPAHHLVARTLSLPNRHLGPTANTRAMKSTHYCCQGATVVLYLATIAEYAHGCCHCDSGCQGPLGGCCDSCSDWSCSACSGGRCSPPPPPSPPRSDEQMRNTAAGRACARHTSCGTCVADRFDCGGETCYCQWITPPPGLSPRSGYNGCVALDNHVTVFPYGCDARCHNNRCTMGADNGAGAEDRGACHHGSTMQQDAHIAYHDRLRASGTGDITAGMITQQGDQLCGCIKDTHCGPMAKYCYESQVRGTCPAPPPPPPPPQASGAHDDSCRYAHDGDCDEPQYCPAGTDCSDCGNCGVSQVSASIDCVSDRTLCMNANGGNLQSGDQIQLWTCSHATNEMYTYMSDHTIRLTANTNLCMNAWLGVGNGNDIKLYDCTAA